MKKTLLTLALIATSVAAFAQGKFQFANDSARLFNIGEPRQGDAAGPIAASPLPSGSTLVASLYGVTGASSSLGLVTSIPLTGTSWLAAGRMAVKSLAMPGIPGGSLGTFAIVLTDLATTNVPVAINGALLTKNGATGIATAGSELFPGAKYYASSGLFTAVPGTSAITYPPIYQTTAPVNSTWAAGTIYVNVVPEPSTFALAGLSAAALLIFRRRK